MDVHTINTTLLVFSTFGIQSLKGFKFHRTIGTEFTAKVVAGSGNGDRLGVEIGCSEVGIRFGRHFTATRSGIEMHGTDNNGCSSSRGGNGHISGHNECVEAFRHIANEVGRKHTIHPNRHTLRDCEASGSSREREFEGCSTSTAINIAIGGGYGSTSQSRHAVGRNLDLLEESLTTIFSPVERTEQTALVHFGCARGDELLTICGENRFNLRGDEAVDFLVRDVTEVGRSLAQRSEAFTDKSDTALAEVALHSLADNGIDEFLRVRDCDFLVPVEVGHGFNRIRVDADVPRVKRHRDFTFVNFHIGRSRRDRQLVLRNTSIGDDEAIGLPVTLAFQLTLEISLCTDLEVASDLAETQGNEFSKGVCSNGISHMITLYERV